MPYREMPWVQNGCVLSADGEPIALDTAAWFRWLEEIPAFCYSPRHGWLRLTVRHEFRRHQRYWYAYSRIDRKLHNVYLGKTHRLTQQRLDDACEQIRQRVRQKGAPMA